MSTPVSHAPQPWWRRKAGRVALFVLISSIIALLAANIGGFLLFLLVVIAAPLIWIQRSIEKDQRRFPRFLWIVYMVWWLIGSLFFWAFSIHFASFDLGWLARMLIGSDIPRLIVSALIGLIVALLLTALPVYLQATIAAKWVLALTRIYNITEWQAVRLMMSLILKSNPPFVIVENGEFKESQPPGLLPRIGGPGLVIIRPYNAVVFEQAGRVTRIEGPGEVLMRLDERIREVVELRMQARRVEATQVLTRDRVPFKITAGAGFRLERMEDLMTDDERLRTLPKRTWKSDSFPAAGRDPEQGKRDESRVHRSSVYKAVYGPRSGRKWQDQIQGDVEGELRRAVRMYNFGEIYNLDQPNDPQVRTTVLDEITERMKEGLRRSSARYGVIVLGASISTIEIDKMQNVQDAYFTALGAEWRKRIALTEAEAEGQAFAGRAKIQQRLMADLLQQFREALAEMARSGMAMSADVVDRYLQVSERLLQNVLTDHSTARRYLDTMETLARVSPSTIIAAGMDVAHLTRSE